MPVEVHCSACNAKLRIPDTLMGKKVRCNKCKAEFIAAEESPVEVVEESADAITVVKDEEIVEEVDEEIPKARAPAAKAAKRPEPDDEPEDEDEGEGRPRRRRKRKVRRTPYERCQAPAFALLLVGYIGGGISVLGVIANLGLNLVASAKAPKGAPEINPLVLFVSAAISVLIVLAWSGAVIQGAKALSAQSGYQMAMTGCIVAMLPCGLGCLFGMPIGLWGLIVLLQEDVKRSFG
jgi:hypothetical protein